jgi:hypothetical protein
MESLSGAANTIPFFVAANGQCVKPASASSL